VFIGYDTLQAMHDPISDITMVIVDRPALVAFRRT
jgi:hypothetical protein